MISTWELEIERTGDGLELSHPLREKSTSVDIYIWAEGSCDIWE